MSRRFLSTVVAAVLFAGPAYASGPGTHVLEANAVLDALVDEEPDWAALADVPLARAYLGFGAMSPDFRGACDEIDFGHQKSLSYHLMDLAESEKPEFRLFALGHMCHQGSDNAMEGLMVGAFFSSAPVGVFSLFGEYLDGRGDSEVIVESMGDLVFGDWHGLVDVLFDMWFEDDAAKDRADEVFQWYCAEAAAFLGEDTDCALAKAQLEDKLASAEGIIGLLDRQAAHDFVDMLVSQPLEDIVDLAGSGLLTSFLGDMGEPTAGFDAEIERMKDSPLTDPTFWALYDDLAHLGPAFTFAQMEHQPPTGAWPVYDKNMVICGNLQSVMRYLPDAYAVITGLTVDQVEWLGPDGQPVAAVTADLVGAPLTARVRLFSAMPFSGTLTGAVRADLPGFAVVGEDIVGAASVDVGLDPAAYVSTPRTELDIPFVADATGALGYTLELTAGDEPRPWFTTSWDHLWSIEALHLASPIYKDNFGTYGHWPPSLPVEAPAEDGASVFVQVNVAPGGPGIAGVDLGLSIEAGGVMMPLEGAVTGANGLAPLDWIPAGNLAIEADGGDLYAGETRGTEIVGGEDQWVTILLHALPRLQPPEFWDPAACVPLTWAPEPFAGQAELLTVTPVDPTAGTSLGPSAELDATAGVGEYCLGGPVPDGTRAAFLAVATYVDGTTGAEGTGGIVTFDGTGPTLTVIPVGFDDDPCVEAGTTGLSIVAEDPASPLVALAWSVDGGDWMELPPKADETGKVIDAHLQVVDHLGAEIRVRVTNAAALETVSEPVVVPQLAAWCGVPEWGPETAPEPGPEPREDTVEPATDASGAVVDVEDVDDAASGGRGCGVGESPGAGAGLLWSICGLLVLGLSRRPRRTPVGRG